MAIGERIHFLRNLRGMTQKYLGIEVGFPESSADVRLAQYESGTRTPKTEMVSVLSQKLGVSPQALTVPDIDSYIGLMHTLFTLEDTFGLFVDEADGDVCLRVDKSKGKDAAELHKMLYAWLDIAKQFKDGGISKEEYDKWRYSYPEFDTTQRWVKMPSKWLSDMLADGLKDGE